MELFHGSTVRGLATIDPKSVSRRYATDPTRVYASPLKTLASIFLLEDINDSWCTIGGYGSDGACEYWVICGDEQRFREVECKGGSLYKLTTENFTFDQVGLGEDEWHSTKPTKVLTGEEWNSALQAMLHYGVKVCFISTDEFEIFREIEDQNLVLAQLAPGADSIYRLTLGGKK